MKDPFTVTEVDSMQWNRTANIQTMKNVAEEGQRNVPEISEELIAEVKAALSESITCSE